MILYMAQKIVGYFLLIIGLFVIITSVFNIYGLLKKTIEPANLFDLQAISVNNEIPIDTLPDNVKSLLGGSLKNSSSMVILSKKDLNDVVNFFAHIFIMGFIMNGGYLVAKIGVKMIREINISVVAPQNKNPQMTT
jgi:hypothetical protein